jgi:large subunit ribosomal protein L29
MKGSELRAKPAADLRAELMKLRKEQFALRLQRATGQAVKPDQFGKVRRSIARLKTALRAGQDGTQPSTQPAAKVAATVAAKPTAKPAAKRATRAVKKTGAK